MNLEQAIDNFYSEDDTQALLNVLKEKIENELQDSNQVITDQELINFLKDEMVCEALAQKCLCFEHFEGFKNLVKLLNELKNKKNTSKDLIENSLTQSINKVLVWETPTRNVGWINADFYLKYASLAPYIDLNHYEVKFAGYECYQIISNYLHNDLEQDEDLSKTPELLRNFENFPKVQKNDYEYDSKGIIKILTLHPEDLNIKYFEFFIKRLAKMPYRLDQDAAHILTKIYLFELSRKEKNEEKQDGIPDFIRRRRRTTTTAKLPDPMLDSMVEITKGLKSNLIGSLQEIIYSKHEKRRGRIVDYEKIVIFLNYLYKTLNENEKKDCDFNKIIMDSFKLIGKKTVDVEQTKELYTAIFYDSIYEKFSNIFYDSSDNIDKNLQFIDFFFKNIALKSFAFYSNSVEHIKERIEDIKGIDEEEVDSEKLNIIKSILSMYDEMQKKIKSTNNTIISNKTQNMTDQELIDTLGCYYFENPKIANSEEAACDYKIIKIITFIVENNCHLRNKFLEEKTKEVIGQILEKDIIKHISDNQPIYINSQFELFKKYADFLIDNNTNIFSEEGRYLRNYLEILNNNPILDYSNRLEMVRKKYIPNETNFSEEEKMLDEFIKNNPISKDETNFEEFLNHLQTLKLLVPNFILPMKYVNYIIKQALEKDSVIDNKPEKYLSLVESVIEDLGKNQLSDQVKSYNNYQYFICDKLDSEIVEPAGLHCSNSKCILIKRANVLNMIKNKDIYALNIVFHENTHADQFNEFKNGKSLSYTRFVMQKEEILKTLLPEFYKDNYKYTFIEIEANEKAALRLAEYIDELNLSDESKIQFLWSFGTDIIKKCSEIAEQKKKDYEEGEIIKSKGKKVNVHQLSDEIIIENPELLKKFPDLLLEYNRDGTKKGLQELYWTFYKQASQTKESVKVWELFGNLVVKEKMLNSDSFISDMELFIENAENIGDVCKNVFSKEIGRIAIELGQNTGSFSDRRIEDLRCMIQNIHHIMEIQSSRVFATAMITADNDDPVYRELRPIDFLDQLDSQLLEEQVSRDSKLAEDQMSFLRMANDGVEQEELYKFEELIVKAESKNHKRSQMSRESKKEKRLKNKVKNESNKNKSMKKRGEIHIDSEHEIR